MRTSVVALSCAFLLSCAACAKAQNTYRVDSVLRCTNQTIQAEAILITELDQPIEFTAQTSLSPSAPEGYLPEPTTYEWRVSSGTLAAKGTHAAWSNPQPGLQRIQVSGTVRYRAPKAATFFSSQLPDIVETFEAEALCIVPLVVNDISSGFVNGFEVGKYPDPTDPSAAVRVRRNAAKYQPPRFFYEVTPETYGLTIYEDYTLGDFDLDPRFSDLTYPRYIALHPDIIQKTVLFEDVARASGYTVSKLKIFYGFRSPKYNLGSMETDGNSALKTPFSMHMYGKAVDFIIDENNDLVLDDLNGDGKTDVQDAHALVKVADTLDGILQGKQSHLVGGAGPYYHHDYWERGEYAQSPYLHIDVRGYTREDGSFIRWPAVDKIGVRQQSDPYRLKQPIPQYPFLLP